MISLKTKRTITVLQKREEFLAVAASGRKWATPGLILQTGTSPKNMPQHVVRYGLTASSKVGNAVTRNRARRRLRVLAEKILSSQATAGDYVLIARTTTAQRSFDDLQNDLITALTKLKALVS